MDIWLFTNECIVFCIVFVSHTRLDLLHPQTHTIATCLVFVQKFKFILMKMHKNCCHQSCSFLDQICTESFVGWGFAPNPTGGAYSAPQTLQLV